LAFLFLLIQSFQAKNNDSLIFHTLDYLRAFLVFWEIPSAIGASNPESEGGENGSVGVTEWGREPSLLTPLSGFGAKQKETK